MSNEDLPDLGVLWLAIYVVCALILAITAPILAPVILFVDSKTKTEHKYKTKISRAAVFIEISAFLIAAWQISEILSSDSSLLAQINIVPSSTWHWALLILGYILIVTPTILMHLYLRKVGKPTII
jgi:hypothetical protein